MVSEGRAHEPALDAEGFALPSWDADVPLAEALFTCPAEAKARGVFFQCIRDQVCRERGGEPEELFGGLNRRRWVVFQNYPVREFIQLASNAATLVAGATSRCDGLRRLGWGAYATLATTMAGRVVLYALGTGLEEVLAMAPKVYEVALSGAQVRSHRVAPRHWRFEMRDVHSFVHSYQVGVLEGTVREHGFEPQVRVRRLERICDADFDVRWVEYGSIKRSLPIDEEPIPTGPPSRAPR